MTKKMTKKQWEKSPQDAKADKEGLKAKKKK